MSKNQNTEMIEPKVGSTLTENKKDIMKKSKVKIKIVVGYPDGVVTTLTDLIQEGMVNVVLFSDYQERISPDVLEEKLFKSFNLNTGWETEPFSWGVEKDGGVWSTPMVFVNVSLN